MRIDEKNIDELLIAYLLDELDVGARRDVELWVATSEENKRKYKEIEQIWSASENTEVNFDSNKAWSDVSPQLSTSNFFLKNWMSIAASVIVFLAVASAYFYLNKPLETTIVYANNTLVPDTLSDGSTVKLNTNSTLSYLSDFNTETRELKLEGEAFFSIRKNPTKAFVVHIPDSRVEVLGTSFNINAIPSDSLVTIFVKSGVVRFSYLLDNVESKYQNIRLTKGEKVVYNKNNRTIIQSSNENQNQQDTYWIDKRLSFDNTRLNEVVRLLENIYDVEINLINPQLNNCQVTVNFEDNNIQEVLTVIASTFGLELKNDNKTYTLNGKACENF